MLRAVRNLRTEDAPEGQGGLRASRHSTHMQFSGGGGPLRLRPGRALACLLISIPALLWSIGQMKLLVYLSTNTLAGRVTTSALSDSFLACMQDVGQHLPLDESCELAPHHLLAGRIDLWNAGVRFAPFGGLLPDAPLILDIGGHTQAEDSREFLRMYPRARIHIYEPVPPYAKELEDHWRGVGKTGQIQIHPVGLGSSTRTVHASLRSLSGQGTYIMDADADANADEETVEAAAETGRPVELRIVDAQDEIMQYLDGASGTGRIDLLHVNCEGCEWEMLLRLAQADTLRRVGVLQVSFHNYGAEGIGGLLAKYCLIREALEKTHHKVEAVPFAWERWTLRDI